MRLTFRLLVISQGAKRRYSSEIPLPPCDFVPKKYKGPSVQHLQKLREERTNPAITPHFRNALGIHQGYKQWLFDFEGKRYLDMFAGICTVAVGHSHPKITEVVTDQIGMLGHISNIYLNPKVYEYAERLTDRFPGNLKAVYFVNSGTEANDLAIMLARAYTQNFDIIALRSGYHGMNNQVMSLSSICLDRQEVPTAAGFHHAMNPDVYRGLWGGKHCRDSVVQTSRECNCNPDECKASSNYVDQLMEVYNYSIPRNRVAAFFAESIQGLRGVIQFPKTYLKHAYEAVKERGGLFVSDEVQTGFGRTGEHFWGFQMHDIIPDIVTLAKGIGNGFPLAAVITTREIAQSLNGSVYYTTYGGNPLACSVGLTVLDIIEEEELQNNCKVVGTYLLEKLSELKNEFGIIGDVRGKGLMIGVELVNGDAKNTPLDSARFMAFWEKCRDLGLLLGRGGFYQNVLRIKPPMCVTREDADFTVAVMKKALLELF